MKLDEQAVEQKLAEVPDWKREDKTIHRRYRFPSFPAAVSFVNGVAELAERLNHHPFISIDYKMVTLRLTSWHAGGLTELDFEEAVAADVLYSSMTSTSETGEQPHSDEQAE